MQKLIAPEYLLESPYRELLTAVSRGDGRFSNIFRRAYLGESVGKDIISDLTKLNILRIEESRQAPLRVHPKHTLKRSLRGHKIEGKARFIRPFHRFWFGFVEPYRADLELGIGDKFMNNFINHKERAVSLVFEQLSNSLLSKKLGVSTVLSQGGFWDHHSEFDLLTITRDGTIILGECKYTSRKVTKKEFTKLKDKAIHSDIIVDQYALFSKSGFSNELNRLNSEYILLFELEDFKALL